MCSGLRRRAAGKSCRSGNKFEAHIGIYVFSVSPFCTRFPWGNALVALLATAYFARLIKGRGNSPPESFYRAPSLK